MADITTFTLVAFVLTSLLTPPIQLVVSLPTFDSTDLNLNPEVSDGKSFRFSASRYPFKSYKKAVFKMQVESRENWKVGQKSTHLIDHIASAISAQWDFGRTNANPFTWAQQPDKGEVGQPKTPQQTSGKRVARYGRKLASVDSKFLSIALDTDEAKYKFRGFDFGSKKLQNLVSALAPANLRFGGTVADFLIFDAKADADKLPTPNGAWETRYERLAEFSDDMKNFTMTGSQWWAFSNFTKLTGMDMMFDFNVFLVRPDGLWNSSNAKEFLDYSAARNISISAVQLGNEPDLFYHYNISIPGDRMVKNFEILQDLIKRYPRYKNSRIVGPDVTSVGRNYGAQQYLTQFLKAGGYKAVSSIGLHQYYMNGKTAKLEDFLDPDVLDYMKTELDDAQSINHEFPPMVDLEFTETSSCYGGGAENLSGKYIAGFLWLDKLGVSAQYGVKAVARQSIYGGSYSLLDPNTDPKPDYYLSVLFKRLVKGSVFHISVKPSTRCLRVYANCARTDYYSYPQGAIVVYYLNLCNATESLTLNQFQYNDLELFQLTPGDEDGLESGFVKLNGEKLEMSGSDLPRMIGVGHRGDVSLPAHSFGFVAVPGAREPLCGA